MTALADTARAFRLGTVTCSRALYDLVESSPRFARFTVDCIARHARKDWGDMDEHDKRANDSALAHGGRVFSAYMIPATCPEHPDKRIWIITEANRSSTTILFPSEY